VAKEAAGRGVLVSAGRHWFPAEAPAPYLRLSFAGVRPEWVAEAVESLAQAMTESIAD
jgi:DNA-binding transcriptional MocR family regulator